MDATALFKLTYGLFVASTQWEDQRCGCVINTAAQVTDTPCRMSVTMQKRNFTTQLVLKKKSLTISVLSLNCPLDVITHFGYQSGRDTDKFASFPFQTDSLGNPYLRENMVAYMSLKVTDTIDLDTHYLFICDVVEAENLAEGKPMTYGDYRIIKAGGSPAAPAHQPTVKWVCSVCHYVYDGDIPFEQLPDDYVCPICKKPKSVFQKIVE